MVRLTVFPGIEKDFGKEILLCYNNHACFETTNYCNLKCSFCNREEVV